MKKITLFASALMLGGALNAQIFTDNFDTYANDSYIGPQSNYWRTWSPGGEGTTEDVKTTNTLSNSPSNSIYFSSTAANGGPQDVLLDFLQLYNSGTFSLKSSFNVVSGKSGYFNIQGAVTVGNVYALDVFMENGKINVQNAGQNKLIATYTPGAWFDLEVVANLTTGIWELKIDGASVGKWENATNSVRYVDYYPLNGSQFYVDDVAFDHSTYTAGNVNASTAELSLGSEFAGTNGNGTLTVVNTGSTNITALNATLAYNGQNYNESVTGLNLAPGQSTSIDFGPVIIANSEMQAVATVTTVNGAADDIATDNSTTIVIDPIIPAPGKMVVSEEGTGTWCQWCPRGAVFMDQFDADYGSLGLWAGIAVHNNDPMDIGSYDSQLAFSGYPSSKVDRGTAVDPSGMYPSFETRIQTAPIATVEVGGTYDNSTRVLQLSGSFTFQQATTSAYKVAFVITEDNVTGNTSAWSQSNAYAGGGQGAMGGYESLPNPVPFSQMVYDHVARDIRPSFGGFTGSFPGTIAQGSTHVVNYTFQLPTTWKADDLHIIALIIAPNGTIENAGKATITEAVANGYEPGVNAGSTVSVSELSQIDETFNLYPNPASDVVNMTFQLKSESTVEVSVLDLSGKTIAARNYGNMNGASVVSYPVSGLTPGVYMVEVTINGEKMIRRMVVE